MDLKEFITESLVEILAAVQIAIGQRTGMPGSAGAINPVFGDDTAAINSSHCQNVEFDVAVTVAEESKGTAKGGIRVWSLEIGGDKSKSAEHSTLSRIKFN